MWSFVIKFKIETLRAQDRELRKTQRDIQRSQQDLERQIKQLEADIKKAAKEGDKQRCIILAKNLVRMRNQSTRCQQVKCQIGTIGSKAKVMNANQKLSTAMQNTTKVRVRNIDTIFLKLNVTDFNVFVLQTLKLVNQQVKPAEMAKTLQEFSKQNQMMDMKEELSMLKMIFFIHF